MTGVGSGRSISTAQALRSYIARLAGGASLGQIKSLAGQIDGGYQIYVKIDRGKNVHRAFNMELEAEFRRLEISVEEADNLVEAVANWCMKNEVLQEGELVFPARFEKMGIELADLVRLARGSNILSFRGDDPKLIALVDEYVRFSAVQQACRGLKTTVRFHDRPLNALAVDRVQLILDIRGEGYSMDELDGAIAFWQDGAIAPVIAQNTVQVSALIGALRAAGG